MWQLLRHQLKWELEKKVFVGFGFAVAFLICIGVVSYHTTRKLAEAENWEIRSNAVLARLEAVFSGLKDAESEQRGYLITGEDQYLESYETAVRKIAQEMRDLRILTADNPYQQRRIDVLEPLLDTIFAEFEGTIAVRKNEGFEPTSWIELTHQSRTTMAQIQQVIGELKDDENQLLQQRGEDVEVAAANTILVIGFSSLMAVVLVTAAAFIINRDIVKRKRADTALRESEARFRRLAENGADIIYRYQFVPTPGYEYVSPTATAICGYSPEEFYADPNLGSKLVHPDDRPIVEALEYPAEATGVSLTVRWIHKNGTVLWVGQRLVPIYDQAGRLVAIEGIIRDVTERIQAYQLLERRVEERTQEIERRRQVAEGLRDILTILNSNRSLDEILDSIVDQACRLLGTDGGAVYRLWSEDEQFDVQASRGLDTDGIAQSIPIGWGVVDEAMRQRRPVAIADTIAVVQDTNDPTLEPRWHADLGRLSKRYGALLAVPLVVKDDSYGAIILYYRQPRQFSKEEIELAVAFSDQAALAIENAGLRSQVEQTAIAAERSRLARDLHDAVTQTLFSASLIADVLPRLWERNIDEAWRRLNELRLLTRGALAEMRMLLLELRPATLAEVGLNELLRQLTEAITGRTQLPVALTVQGQPRLPPDVQIAFYRIAQEALNNVTRHAGASQVAVRLSCEPEQIELSISDDGQGFDTTCVSLEHLGLKIMHERAETIGATLRIESHLGSGSQIVITWLQPNSINGPACEREPILEASSLALAGRETYE